MIHFKPTSISSDFKTVAELAKDIWTEHYTPIIGLDQVNYMLSKFQSEKAIESQVLTIDFKYFIIYNESSPIGYLSIKKEGNSLFLSKIYILKSSRGKGIGKKTMNFIENQAKTLNCKSIYLTVNKHNTNSIKVYEKIDYKKIQELVMDIGNDYVMDDYKMEKLLTN